MAAFSTEIDSTGSATILPHPPDGVSGQSDPSFFLGQCLVYSQSKKVAGIPLQGGAFKKVNPSYLPRDSRKRFADDYITAFMDICGGVARGFYDKPAVKSRSSVVTLKSNIPTAAALEEDNHGKLATVPSSLASRNGHGSSYFPSYTAEKSKARRRGRPKMNGSTRKRSTSGSSEEDIRSESLAPSSTRTSSERSLTDSLPFILPKRQSERKIREKLLSNVVQNDGLGVGLDDDANQRRSWQKARVHPVVIKKHKFHGKRSLKFLVQQKAGNCEWRDASVVDEALQQEYKVRTLGLSPTAPFPHTTFSFTGHIRSAHGNSVTPGASTLSSAIGCGRILEGNRLCRCVLDDIVTNVQNRPESTTGIQFRPDA